MTQIRYGVIVAKDTTSEANHLVFVALRVNNGLLVAQHRIMRHEKKNGELRGDVHMMFAKFREGTPPNHRALASAAPEVIVDSRGHPPDVRWPLCSEFCA